MSASTAIVPYSRNQKRNKPFFEKFREQPVALQAAEVVGAALLINWGINKYREARKGIQYATAYGSEMQGYQQQGISLSYPQTNYLLFADTLEQAMQYSGTYEGDIVDVFSKMRTNADVLELIKVFGTRTIYFFGIGYDYTLPAALREELSQGYIDEINSTLAKKGITYRF